MWTRFSTSVVDVLADLYIDDYTDKHIPLTIDEMNAIEHLREKICKIRAHSNIAPYAILKAIDCDNLLFENIPKHNHCHHENITSSPTPSPTPSPTLTLSPSPTGSLSSLPLTLTVTPTPSPTPQIIVSLLGINEVPANNSSDFGIAELTFNSSNSLLNYKISLQVVNATAVTINRNDTNQIVFALMSGTIPATFSGSIDLSTDGNLLLFNNGNLFIQVTQC